ncbi:MAG TPA: ABC transporter permease, partial [Chthoniobacteraceae bacterium]|nr:ABC transporter permease [Chthoniobacteraceae bacterium]
DMDPHEIGYVPQFSIAFDLLSVRESVDDALRLRVAGLTAAEREERVEKILREVGLDQIADRRARVLSGGQKRRLALALEMVSTPHLLLCDEVTSGLDPKAEDEIAKLMFQLSRREERIVLSVTHSLRHLALYDSVLVLFHGHLAYHAPHEFLFHYFNVEHADELFPRLAQRAPEEWHQSWLKHRAAYQSQFGAGAQPETIRAGSTPSPANAETLGPSPDEQLKQLVKKLSGPGEDEPPVEAQTAVLPAPMPGFATQFATLLARRGKLFLRDRGQLALQAALLIGFPILVVIFALDGLPQIKNLNGVLTGNFLEQLQNQFTQESELMRTGSLVSGLVMFQVVLLALMGSNNSAREIAGERLIFEKEKFAGLRPSAYVASKAVFLGLLVLAQSVWMTAFVKFVVNFPGSLGAQMLLLTLVNAALTAICLGLSSVMKTAEQASLVSIYLVGFQLPLSGAVLALPASLAWITRPFIASYWGWSGYVLTLRDTRFYEAVLKITQTHLSAEPLCVWVLACHVILGLVLAYTGCKSARWE